MGTVEKRFTNTTWAPRTRTKVPECPSRPTKSNAFLKEKGDEKQADGADRMVQPEIGNVKGFPRQGILPTHECSIQR